LRFGGEVRQVQHVDGRREIPGRDADNSLLVDRRDGIDRDRCGGVIRHAPQPLDRDVSLADIEQHDAR